MWREISIVKKFFNFILTVLVNLNKSACLRAEVDLRIIIQLRRIIARLTNCEDGGGLLHRIFLEVQK
jgi:hypothetical protein